MEITIVVAFVAGLISFFAPCVIPLLPAYIGYISGVSLSELSRSGIKDFRLQIMLSSISYIVGFSFIFVLLGVAAAGIGASLRVHNDIIQILGGALIMFFALNFMGIIKIPLLEKGHAFKLPSWTFRLGYLRAFLVGMIFATAWTPCVGAVLGSILTLAATSTSVVYGGLLLFVYSLGISVPFLIISLTLSQAPRLLSNLTPHLSLVQKIAGGMLLIIGFLLFNNNLEMVSPLLTYDHLNAVLFKLLTH